MLEMRPLFPLHLVERIDRAILARLLATFGIGWSDPGGDGLAFARGVWERAHGAGAPEEVRAAFVAIAAVASGSARETILRADREHKLPASLGPESTAALAWLEAPEAFGAARVQATVEEVQGYAWFDAARNRPIDVGPARVERLRAAGAAIFAARRREAYCEPIVTETVDRVFIVLVHCKTPETRDVFDAGVRRVATQTPADRVYAVLDKVSGRLGIHARPYFVEPLRRVLGEALFDDPDHFSTADLLTLDPLAAGERALEPAGVPGVLKVELRAIELWSAHARQAWGYVAQKNDVRVGPRGARVKEDLGAGDCVATSVKLALFVVNRARPLLVEIVPGSRKLKYDARDAAAEAVLMDWLTALGYLRAPALEAPAAPVDESGQDAAPRDE